jgi:DNA invertase Pin-like site-specific DNA recombinase
MIVGYARVSTSDQHLHLQHDALTKAGCEKIYQDQLSGASTERPGWNQARAALREGDTLVVWRLDRLGRSLKHLIDTIAELNNAGVAFKSVTENLDTGSTGGRLIFHIFGALAEFERELIRERTHAGLTAARARGRKGGRPPALDAKAIASAQQLLRDPNQSVTEVARLLGVARSTLYRALKTSSKGGG